MDDDSDGIVASDARIGIRRMPATVYEIAAWPGAESALERFIDAHGTGEQHALLSMGPNRIWIVDAASRDLPETGTGLAMIDLSHALALFRLNGDAARLVLRKGLPIDLHASEFPAGCVATSAIESIVVTVHNRGNSLDLYCRRSFGESLEHWLVDAALEFAGSP